jgi:TPP-dependent indolepyruvate ferredoxin oxidoreductase alpha subunit
VEEVGYPIFRMRDQTLGIVGLGKIGTTTALKARGLGMRVIAYDPFDLEETRTTLNQLIENRQGVKVLILRQECALSPRKRHTKQHGMHVNETLCPGEECGCDRLLGNIPVSIGFAALMMPR